MAETTSKMPEPPVVEPPLLTDEALKTLATDIVGNRVFTSNHLREHEMRDLPMVFMPLMLGGMNRLDLSKVGLVWEFISEAGPRSVNGLPVFFSCSTVHISQMPKLNILVRKLEAAMKGALDGES